MRFVTASGQFGVRAYRSDDSLERGDGLLVIAVQDAGSLEKDFRVESGWTRQRKESSGLGFGLEIIQKIISELGGRLTFQSEPTTFFLNLRGHSR